MPSPPSDRSPLLAPGYSYASIGDKIGSIVLAERTPLGWYLGFGLAFELPVVVLVLVRFGLITYEFMARTRPYAIVLIFILATIITPTPDVLTLIAMSLPMVLLYESCIWIAWFMKRRQSRAT